MIAETRQVKFGTLIYHEHRHDVRNTVVGQPLQIWRRRNSWAAAATAAGWGGGEADGLKVPDIRKLHLIFIKPK